ncbi:MAG: 2,3-bisphosphoglycerate-independent phosphoglycerate mutase [Candidatus Moranbacteria bacterium]|nr:2,3-bisphosphoglycerate-independent phosphoglycerate mutase [Candidatus Moranbacteria bacterium]
MYKPVVLVVLDGWGLSNTTQGNPIREATLPTFDKLNRYYPMTSLQASGIAVGLPWNTPGNSEVGHMTMGAGRVIYQNMPRITLAIQDGTFFKNEALLSAMNRVAKNNSSLHIMGLVSEGSVHAHKDHLYMLMRMAKEQNLKKVFIHAFTDGRDSSPTSGIQSIRDLEGHIRTIGVGKVASLAGRNWSMDRNNNWERIEKTYDVLTKGEGEHTASASAYLEACYAKGMTDEYIDPCIIMEKNAPVATIQDGDSVIFFNFREDRARELTKAFTLPGFDKFDRPKQLDLEFVTMTEYEKDLPVSIAFPPEEIHNSLGETLSKNKKKQARIAETEKYAHVTYFFNGGTEQAFEGEDRFLIPSQTVPHFDDVPEMGAPQITEKAIELIDSGKYDFILINYANPDMVGHTGNEQASIKAVEATDKSLSLLIPAVMKVSGAILVTSDHGNVEEVKNLTTGEIDTEHSTNPIPFWLITSDNHREKTAELMVREENQIEGLLSDVAPTVLEIMGIQKPPEMHGESLLGLLK